MDEHAKEYGNWLAAKGLARSTVKQRVTFARSRLAQWGSEPPEPHVVAEWLSEYAGWTRRTYVAHLRSWFAFLLDTGQIASDPLQNYRRPPSPSPNPRPLPADELAAILSDANPRLAAWLMLAFFAGLRRHEVAKMHGRNIDSRRIVVLGKGGQLATVPTHPELWDLAQHYPRDDYWFPSPHNAREHVGEGLVGMRVREHLRKHNIPTGGIHRIRASYGTSLAREGVHVHLVRELMRHRSLETTQRYLAADDDELMAAVRRLRVA